MAYNGSSFSQDCVGLTESDSRIQEDKIRLTSKI